MLGLIPDNYYPCELLPLEGSVLAGTPCSTGGSVMPQDTLHAPDVPDAASMRPRCDHNHETSYHAGAALHFLGPVSMSFIARSRPRCDNIHLVSRLLGPPHVHHAS